MARENNPALDKYFRAVYGMQVVAVLSTLGGMALAWWNGAVHYSALDLLNLALSPLAARDSALTGQPLIVLWLLVPSLAVSGLRGVTGMLVTPVAYRWLALVLCGISGLVLAHFYLNTGAVAVSRDGLDAGSLGPGFWLTGSSSVILGLLILAEWTIRPPLSAFAPGGGPPPTDDPARRWQGGYQSCPSCGVLNPPDARRCYNCRRLLFFTVDRSPDAGGSDGG